MFKKGEYLTSDFDNSDPDSLKLGSSASLKTLPKVPKDWLLWKDGKGITVQTALPSEWKFLKCLLEMNPLAHEALGTK